ncbi:MAG: mannose-6-phosphate isomerase, class I, partial [Micromonosporaceae bacterium]
MGRIRPYAWGSRTGIAAVQGRTPSGGPEAELWFGAHPDDPSPVIDGAAQRSLLDMIDADPDSVLGSEVVDRYGPRLPFLLKVLAAERPLSLQVHPDSDQARDGFAAEEAAGVPRDAPYRNYVDPYHKPELLLAVTEFDALCGFRTAARSADALRRLGVPELESVADALGSAPPEAGLRQAVTALFALPVGGGLIGRVRDACVRHAAGPDAPPEYALAADLAARYPDDVGVLVSFLL